MSLGMQTFLPLFFFYDENKTLLENLVYYFTCTAKTLDNKRTGKQRVEAMQLLNILFERKASSAWRNHPVLKMWKPWSEALKVYYNSFIQEWISRGFKNTMVLENIDENKINEQGVPQFLTNKHFINRMRSNLLSKDETFYSRYNWPVSLCMGYYWLIDGQYYLTLNRKKYLVDLSGPLSPPDPIKPPSRSRSKRAIPLSSLY